VPTYQYTCTDCGEPVEVVQKFTDDPLSVCAACGGRLRKVFSPVGIVFKGSGFYRTDSRNGSGSTAAAKDKQQSEASSGTNGTSDRPADKADKKASDKSDKVTASSGSSSSSSSEKVA
jgi:putative FmdB family regulatory protein